MSAVCLELRDSQDQLVFQDQKDPTEMPVKKALRVMLVDPVLPVSRA